MLKQVNVMKYPERKNEKIGIRSSPWLVVGSAIILLTVVLVLAIRNYNREKQHMSRVLQEKGAALIRAVEAGARTGMMRMSWGSEQVQTLLEQTAQMSGVIYMALIDRNGTVIAHSDSDQIDSMHHRRLEVAENVQENWSIVELAKGERAFEVYRQFRPGRGPGFGQPGRTGKMMHRHGRKMGRFHKMPDSDSRFEQDLVILAGLDVGPFEEARKQDIRNTIVISAVLLLLGFGGFISMFWAHNYRVTSQSLRDTSAFADEVVTSLPVGLIATGKDGKIAFFNGTAELITGIAAADAIGRTPEQVIPFPWKHLKDRLAADRTILEEELECTFSDRKAVPVNVSASRIVNDQGEFVGNILILRNMEEIRRLQEEIRRQEKLAAIGGLAAGVAHEIRNPLSSIKGIASYFRSKSETNRDDREAADVMIQEVDRLNRAITELLEFARPTELRTRITDLADLLQHSIRLVQQDAAANNITIRLDLPPEPISSDIDPDRFSQCLLNLYLNSIQAMDHGGELNIQLAANAGNVIQIVVSDTGNGIQPADLKKIFDPYFTSKPSGTGLGLAIVHKIITAHQGRIQVNSKPGEGTRFTVILPLKPNEVQI